MTRALTFLAGSFELDAFLRIKRCQVVKQDLVAASSGDSKLTASILTSAKYSSCEEDGLVPLMVSPVLRSNLRIWTGRRNVVGARQIV